MPRIENDEHITTQTCFEPLVQAWLAQDRPLRAVLIVDPTTQDERVVKLTVSMWYRGRALPLVWDTYPTNQPLEGPGFWERTDALLRRAQALLPPRTAVVGVAACAFGTPQFTDLVEARGWSYLVRVQGQTRCRDQVGVERRVDALVQRPGQRAHLKGAVFKGRGWRAARVVVYWRDDQASPLCLVTNLARADTPAQLIHLYRRRFAIEAAFRDEKTRGW
ncbi:MAG: transposase [Chloroflexi bacterium]|nr:transposase [Chloroflexota bacterium]